MKKLLTAFSLLVFTSISYAQDSTAVVEIAPPALTKQKREFKIAPDQAGDHFMITLTSDNWAGAPDSIKNRKSGLSRGLNVAIMLNKPFKSDPRWSVALGLGISHSSIFFKNTSIDVKASGVLLPFRNLDSADRFKKYKLATTYAEIPIELRYTFNPEAEKRSTKLALGIKVGTLINAHTKGKTLQNKASQTINSYTEKESRKTFFNNTRLAGTARIGIGNFSLFGSYSITSFLKDGAGPTIRPYQIGLTISGL
ncbi:MAG: outer membrane beta-barrel protein [Ferruginibacter sp.]|nr:outer membrane beta-barrel protein [Ferruginibacter sp.]